MQSICGNIVNKFELAVIATTKNWFSFWTGWFCWTDDQCKKKKLLIDHDFQHAYQSIMNIRSLRYSNNNKTLLTILLIWYPLQFFIFFILFLWVRSSHDFFGFIINYFNSNFLFSLADKQNDDLHGVPWHGCQRSNRNCRIIEFMLWLWSIVTFIMC